MDYTSYNLNNHEIWAGIFATVAFFLSTYIASLFDGKYSENRWIITSAWFCLAAWELVCDGHRLQTNAGTAVIYAAIIQGVVYSISKSFENARINMFGSTIELNNKNEPISNK